MADNNPSNYNIPGSASTIGTIPVAQAPVTQAVAVNLAAGATVSADFTIDGVPYLDVIVFADQAIDINVYVRTAAGGNFRLLDGQKQASGVANVMKQPIRGLRVGGTQARVEFANNSGVATTVFEGLITFRPL